MQLVEQRLEFVVTDFIADGGRRNAHRHARGNGRRDELALAMQLVEQRLELIVSDFIGCCHGTAGLGRWLTQSIEQLLELAIGNVARCRFHGLDLRLGYYPTRRLGQARQGSQQLAAGRSRFDALAHLGEHAIDRIERFQHHVHQFGVDATLTLAQDVEDVFGNMAALHQLIQLEETGAALDGMETTKNGVEQVHIVRAAF
ncbi:hypothetical protein D9M68_797890 [compost metagenome]